MYHHISDFLSDWEYESGATLKLFRNLKDDSLKKTIHPNVRSLGFLCWHLIHTMQEMLLRVGLKVDVREQLDYNGESVKELCDIYEKGSRSVADVVKAKWTDKELELLDDMYGEMWKRGQTLTTLVRHQAHHRAEMIVVMRMLNLSVIGIYGPTKEEWAQWGMEPMK